LGNVDERGAVEVPHTDQAAEACKSCTCPVGLHLNDLDLESVRADRAVVSGRNHGAAILVKFLKEKSPQCSGEHWGLDC